MALFGTNGVRGIVNEELTIEMSMNLARSLAAFLQNRGKKSQPTVVIGTDTRISGMMLKAAAVSGLLESGILVIDVGTVPTPSLQYYIKNRQEIDAGIVITASHNPREYNGIKLIAGDGTEFSREDEKAVEDIYNAGEFKAAAWSKTGSLCFESNCNEEYLTGILAIIDRKAIEKKAFKVVTDTGNGAGSLTLPDLMSRLGCKVMALGAQPDGTFPWRNPEPLPDALKEAVAVIRDAATSFDLGIAQDGDADRAVFIDEKGEFIDEEVMLAAVEKYILHKEKGPVVTTVSTSQRFTDIAKDEEVDIYYTPVGSIDVGRKMVEVGAVYGGEGNGGIIYPRHQICRDGAMAAVLVLEMLAHTGMKASEIKDTVPTYFNEKTKIKIAGDLKTVMQTVSDKIKKDEKEIGCLNIETIDGLKLWFAGGWLLIRPSGTEPIIRVTAEAKIKTDVQKYLEIGEKYLNEFAE
ncbi:phosphoglucosamine mutase [Methanimicrococcus sp. OttesenSCG-928-J09]|nr:phosphoglucosamine mutase [Methanimicrococcus sp. OttesenSCG-928-J09]